ncbi:hypothetical protein CDL12_08784 [Handroanthus impetiginosus]|uniref:Uncharacterized protein n=1 Tax=Handroanthus impetiginosus TaxID=429701 RepID=A0A2G9HM00_9LAMI|nr:hypothetical protein CDL12_08784 [Handroanthus impetiginosus]
MLKERVINDVSSAEHTWKAASTDGATVFPFRPLQIIHNLETKAKKKNSLRYLEPVPLFLAIKIQTSYDSFTSFNYSLKTQKRPLPQ